MSNPLATQPLTLIERSLALANLVIGILFVAAALLAIALSFLPAPSGHDNAILGLLGGLAILPFGLAALAAFDAIRKRSSGRWVLQLIVIAPILVLGYSIVTH